MSEEEDHAPPLEYVFATISTSDILDEDTNSLDSLNSKDCVPTTESKLKYSKSTHFEAVHNIKTNYKKENTHGFHTFPLSRSSPSLYADSSGAEDGIFKHWSADRPLKHRKRRIPPVFLSDGVSHLHLSDISDDLTKPQTIKGTSQTATIGKSVLIPKSGRHRESKITFTTIEIRRYERILGDNPSCSHGPALSIGWEYDRGLTSIQKIDDYEYCKNRCYDGVPILSRAEREKMLFDLGYTRKDLSTAVRLNLKLKVQRRQTVNNLRISPMEEIFEGASKKIARVIKKRKESKFLYKQWKKEVSDGYDHSSYSGISLKSSFKKSSATLDESTNLLSQNTQSQARNDPNDPTNDISNDIVSSNSNDSQISRSGKNDFKF